MIAKVDEEEIKCFFLGNLKMNGVEKEMKM